MSKNDLNESQNDPLNYSNISSQNNDEFKENNEKSNEQENPNINNSIIKIEVKDELINTEKLNDSELNRLIKANQDLIPVLNDDKGNNLNPENISYNIGHEIFEISQKKKDLINDIIKDEEFIIKLKNENNILDNKIKSSEKKFTELKNQIEEKKGQDAEEKLELQIKELEKEIKANNIETEHYKKLIDKLKDEIEFKEGIERANNFQNILKQEELKNRELKLKLENLNRINIHQAKYMDNYIKKHKTKEKEEQLKSGITQNKNLIKEYNNKYLKLDRYIKAMHAKITGVKIYIGKIINEPKIEEKKKIFTDEETKDAIGIITNLKAQINEKRKELNEIQKNYENKMHEILVKNKQIEMDYNEDNRIYKSLIYKRNEINKKLRSINNLNKKLKVNENYINVSNI